jgi:hypothetical protein
MNVTFLLGAGISIPALPLSTELDSLVRTGGAGDGRVVLRGTDSLYRLEPANGRPDEWSPRVRKFLDWLAEWLDPEPTDYESLYFACQQLTDHLMGEYENPLLHPFIDECVRRVVEWKHDDPADDFDGTRTAVTKLREVVREATNYISGAVAEALRHSPEACDDLAQLHKPLLEACRDRAAKLVDVITLNHDTLLEDSFQRAGIRPEDGFGNAPDMGGVERWRGYSLRRTARERLVKLHGSIDWWVIQHGDLRRLVRNVGCPFRLRDHFDQVWDTPDSQPRMLVGTTNKLLAYVQAFNIDRLAVFRRSLMRSEGLVVAGYSFRDKGVNTLLIDWSRGRGRAHRVAIVSPHLEGEAPPSTARNAARRMWEDLVARRRLWPIPNCFHAVEWPEVRRFLQRGERGDGRV